MAKGTGNLAHLAKYFSDENAARELLESLRWPNGAACPRCGGADPYKLTPKPSGKNPARQGLYKCRACKRQFTVTVGTVFESSHVPLSKWLLAIHLMCASKKGLSAHQLHRMLDITYRAAWFINHRLRYAMATQEGLFAKLSGVVEMDETYVGARHKRGTKRGRPGPDSYKAPVVALVERRGRVRASPVARVTADNLKAALAENAVSDVTLMTDELKAYKSIRHADHQTVNHSLGEYVRADVHTNTAEGLSRSEAGHQRLIPPRLEGPPAMLLLGVRVPLEHADGARRGQWRTRGVARSCGRR